MLDSDVSDHSILFHLFQDVVDPGASHNRPFVDFFGSEVVGAGIFHTLEGLNLGFEGFRIRDAESFQNSALFIG